MLVYQVFTLFLVSLGEPPRSLCSRAVGLSAPSPSPLRGYGGSATIPLAAEKKPGQQAFFRKSFFISKTLFIFADLRNTIPPT
jgi:hypothetical protein